MKKIAIIGSGGLGREILGIIQSINREEKIWDFIGFYDDNFSKELINGYPIIGNIEDINLVDEELFIVIGVGNPKVREILHKKILNPRVKFPKLIHPSVVIYDNEYVKIGEGVVIGANSVLTVNINLGNHVYINTAAIISHDVSINDFSMVMPTVCISAGAQVGKRVYIGNGVKIDCPLDIANDTHIKAGAILSK